MSELSQVVHSTISVQDGGVSAAGFGTLAICGPHTCFTERMRSYGDPSELVTDGFAPNDPIYILANAAFSQNPRPLVVKVGRLQVAQVKIRVHDLSTDTTGNVYSVLLDGVARSYTGVGGQDETAVATAWAAVLDGLTGFTATSSGSVITLGIDVTTTAFKLLPNAASTGDFTIYYAAASMLGETGSAAKDKWVAGLTAIQTYDADWYGLATTARFYYAPGTALNDIEMEINDWREATTVLGGAATVGIGTAGTDNDILDVAPLSDTTSLFARGKAGSYDRSFGFYQSKARGSRYFIITITATDDAENVVYAVTMDGETYTHTGTAGQTEIGVATALTALIDAAAVATAEADQNAVYVYPATEGYTLVIVEDPTNVGALSISTVDDEGADAAWIARQLAVDIDLLTSTWAHKNLAAVSYDRLTTTQIVNVIGNPLSNLTGKNGNVYTELGGGTTRWGQAYSGQFLDIQHGVDWLNARIAEEIYSILARNEKVTYDDDGIKLLGSAVRQWLQIAQSTGFLARDTAKFGAEGFSITLPAASSITTTVKRTRKLSGTAAIKWNGTAAGAIHAVAVAGTLTL